MTALIAAATAVLFAVYVLAAIGLVCVLLEGVVRFHRWLAR